MEKYLSAQKMLRSFRRLKWSYRRIARFVPLPPQTVLDIAKGGRIPRESTEEKIRIAYKKIFESD